MQVLYTLFELSCWYCPRISKLKMLLPLYFLQVFPNWWYLSRITVGAGLQERDGCTKIQYKCYKKATQTHFSYTSFYLIAVSNSTYCLPICLGLIHLIKSYNCWVNFIMIAITMNYLDGPIYYNVIVKLAIPMLPKGIPLGLVSILLKGIHHRSG